MTDRARAMEIKDALDHLERVCAKPTVSLEFGAGIHPSFEEAHSKIQETFGVSAPDLAFLISYWGDFSIYSLAELDCFLFSDELSFYDLDFLCGAANFESAGYDYVDSDSAGPVDDIYSFTIAWNISVRFYCISYRKGVCVGIYDWTDRPKKLFNDLVGFILFFAAVIELEHTFTEETSYHEAEMAIYRLGLEMNPDCEGWRAKIDFAMAIQESTEWKNYEESEAEVKDALAHLISVCSDFGVEFQKNPGLCEEFEEILYDIKNAHRFILPELAGFFRGADGFLVHQRKKRDVYSFFDELNFTGLSSFLSSGSNFDSEQNSFECNFEDWRRDIEAFDIARSPSGCVYKLAFYRSVCVGIYQEDVADPVPRRLFGDISGLIRFLAEVVKLEHTFTEQTTSDEAEIAVNRLGLEMNPDCAGWRVKLDFAIANAAR